MEAKGASYNPVGEQEVEENEEKAPAQEPAKPWGPIDRQYAKIPADLPRRIHIVGTGSIGKLVAHSLRGIPDPPPVTLVFHRGLLAKAWDDSKKQITLQDGEYTVPRGGFDFELSDRLLKQHGVTMHDIEDKQMPDMYDMGDATGMKTHEVAKVVRGHKSEDKKKMEEAGATPTYKPFDLSSVQGRQPNIIDTYRSQDPIHNLIVTTKTVRTISALSGLKHRLSRDSTICFLQNGMGVIDAVNKEIFPDEATRPSYIQGIVSHGANVPPEIAEKDPFFVVHAGHGTISLGAVPRKSLAKQVEEAERPPTPTGPDTGNDGQVKREQVEELPASSRYLLRTLARTPVLAAVAYTPLELLQLQLEKLAVNSILNPLTALFDDRNGSLNYNFPVTRLKRLMLAETSLVIRSLPELKGLPNVPSRFSAERLENVVFRVADQTRDNISSMLADIRAGRQTEIEYINGYIVKKGEELGVKCVVNYAMMQAVMGKSNITQREYSGDVPVAGEGEGLNRE